MDKIKIALYALIFVFIYSCTKTIPGNTVKTEKHPAIFPEYCNAVIPCNIAPLNFKVKDAAGKIFVSIKGKNGKLEKSFTHNKTNWSLKEWNSFLKENKGDSIFFSVYTYSEKGKWKEYKPFGCFVSPDSIDEYLFYRLIPPAYQSWNKMGLYQRNLTSFEQKTITDSKIMSYSCVNCHTLSANNPDNMVFHFRGRNGGTVILKDGEAKMLKTEKPSKVKSVSFPSWHPSNRYIAFSIDKIRQLFPSFGTERAHALDLESDMVIYDIDKKKYLISPLLFSKDAYEAFPCFSPDGKSLYFISAPALPMPKNIRKIQYSLCRIDFEDENGTIGEHVDTLISPKQTGKSLTMPRISPDGKNILLTLSNYGDFPAYNKEADLYMYNIEDSSLVSLDILNSDDVESYHAWSSTGKWMVFSSRRMDGLFMNAYIAHVDENGSFSKPFLLPQKDPDFHQSFLFSFNLPEFSIKPMPVSPIQIEKLVKKENRSK